IVWADNRENAIERMKRAISEYRIAGVANTLRFGEWVMNHEKFKEAEFDTGFIAKYYHPEDEKESVSAELGEALALLSATAFKQGSSSAVKPDQNESKGSEWYRQRRQLR